MYRLGRGGEVATSSKYGEWQRDETCSEGEGIKNTKKVSRTAQKPMLEPAQTVARANREGQ